ncbi:MAG: ATP-binding cassette domain-containing protein, partial [Dolichospermum sp.]
MNTDQHQLTSEIILDLQEINVSYGGIQALKKVNLTIKKGEVVTLVGANGAGKTTTLKAISKMLNPQSGNIIYQ